MSIRCPNCGRDNRDTAQFCVGCGQKGLQAPASKPWTPPQMPSPSLVEPPPAPLAPAAPAQLMAPAPAAAPARKPVRGMLGVRPDCAPVLRGTVDTYNQDEVFPPPDGALALAKVGVGLAILPLVLYLFAGLGILLIVIIILGGGIILAIFGALIGAFTKLFTLLMPRRRPQDRKLTQIHLIIQDAAHSQSAVVLYSEHIAGMLHKGDEVEVYGRREGSGLVRATRIDIVGAQFAPGGVARRVVKGRRPFPRSAALVVWGLAATAWVFFYLPAIMQLLDSR